MSATRALYLGPRQRRKFISSLFGLTALASVITVSASAILPCPVDRSRYLDAQESAATPNGGRRGVVVEKKPRRWIEETKPAPRAPPPNAQP